MARSRIYPDAAAKQRAYRERLKAYHRAHHGPTDTDLARVARDFHIRLEYEAALHPGGPASQLVGDDPLATLRNALARLG